MNKFLIITAILIFYFSSNVQGVEKSTNKISGVWETEPYLSQMGTIVSKYDFKSNNECISSMIFLDAKLPELSDKWHCEFKEDTLVIKNKNGVFLHTYTLQDGILTIIESGGDTYRFKRK